MCLVFKIDFFKFNSQNPGCPKPQRANFDLSKFMLQLKVLHIVEKAKTVYIINYFSGHLSNELKFLIESKIFSQSS